MCVQQHSGDAVESLAEQAGKTGRHNIQIHPEPGGSPFQGQAALGPAGQEHGQKNPKADDLAQRCGKARARDPHTHSEHKDGISDHVEDGACHQSDHAQGGPAFIAEDIIHGQAGRHERRRDQDIGNIGPGKGRDGLRAAQSHDHGTQDSKADAGDDRAAYKGTGKAGRSVYRSPLRIPAAQSPGNGAAGTLAEHKGKGLDDRHEPEYDADSSGGAVAQLPDKGRIHQIIDIGDQHTDNGRG